MDKMPGPCPRSRGASPRALLTSVPVRWALVLTVAVLLSAETSEVNRRKRQGLKKSCSTCAPCAEKGCSPCQPRLFMLIWRVGIQQHVTCVHTCPSGYFSMRGRDVNRCTKCRAPSCDRCFSKDFCMKCKEESFLHHGKCSTTCPPGTMPQLSTRECQECELTSWSPWTLCSRNGQTCGYKWGTETRARETRRWLSKQEARIDLGTCQPLAQEERKCRLRKFCPADRSDRRAGRRKEKKQGLRTPHKEA